MVFQILLNFYLNRLGTLRMQNLIMLKKKRNDTMLFKQLLHFLAALICCFLVLFNTKRHKFQFCYLLCVTHFLLDFTLQNYTFFPKTNKSPHELRKLLGLLLQLGQLFICEAELAFSPGFHAESDARLRVLHHVHFDEFQQFIQFGAA